MKFLFHTNHPFLRIVSGKNAETLWHPLITARTQNPYAFCMSCHVVENKSLVNLLHSFHLSQYVSNDYSIWTKCKKHCVLNQNHF